MHHPRHGMAAKHSHHAMEGLPCYHCIYQLASVVLPVGTLAIPLAVLISFWRCVTMWDPSARASTVPNQHSRSRNNEISQPAGWTTKAMTTINVKHHLAQARTCCIACWYKHPTVGCALVFGFQRYRHIHLDVQYSILIKHFAIVSQLFASS